MDCPVPQPPHLRADATSPTSAAPPQRVQLLPLAHLLTTAPGAQRHRHSRLHHSAHAHYPTAFACAHTISLSGLSDNSWPLSQMSSLSPHWCDTQKELITASSPSCSSASDTRQLSANSLQLSYSYPFLVFINRKKSSIFHHNWDRLHKKGIQSSRSTGTLHLLLLHTYFEYFNRIC